MFTCEGRNWGVAEAHLFACEGRNWGVAEAHFVYMRRQKLGSSGKRLKLYSDDVYLVICVWNNNLHEPEMNYGIYAAAIIIC